MKVKKLSLKDIHLEDERFRTSYYFELNNLILSMNKVGILTPPFITKRDNNFILVSGWKRVLASQELSFSSLPFFVLEKEDDIEAFLFAFYENWASRPFSLLEKAEILAKLRKFGMNEQEVIQQFLPLLGIPRTLSHLDSFLEISRYESEVKKVIHEKDMPFSSAKLLSELTSRERKQLLPMITPLGKSKQKELLEHLLEITLKNDVSPLKVLNSREILRIQGSERLSSLQKADRIRFLLRKMRYPTFSAWKDAFDSWKKDIDWPEETSVEPSAFFEDEYLSLTIRFKNREELQGRLSRLQDLASKIKVSSMVG
jgi:ParB family chromosome partitioning protein